MIIFILIILLFLSFSIHLYIAVQYVSKRQKKYLIFFLNTGILNILIAFAIIYISIKYPEIVRKVNMKHLMWAMSGLLMVLTLSIQIAVFKRVYARAQIPEHYHLNFFGKKVLHPSVITKGEFTTFIGTIPFLLLGGAYFVARLINYFLYGHL